jgi:hypothetical protein
LTKPIGDGANYMGVDEDQQIFTQIAIDIRKHPNKYKRTGKWLDNYCKDVIKEQGLPLLTRFTTARQDLAKKYGKQVFISEDDALCIILITWLLTDADAEKAKLAITELEKWSWEPTNDFTCGSRCSASSLWRQNNHAYGLWMYFVRASWAKLYTEKKFELEQPAETGGNATLAKIWACIKRVPRWIYVLVIFLAAFLTCIYFLWWLWTTFWKK